MRKTLLAFLAILCMFTLGNAQSIGIFTDPDYIDLEADGDDDDDDDDPNCEAEGLVVQEVVSNLGYSFITIGDEDDLPTVLPGLEILIIPENEQENFAPTGAVLTAIQEFVNDGGKVIVMNSTSVLFDIFGFTITGGDDDDDDDDDDDSIDIITGSTTGTCYETSGVSSLSFNNATDVLESMLPDGSICYYKDGDRAGVASIPYGDGSVCFLGWDWYYCDSEDTDEEKDAWDTVLGCMIQEAGVQAEPIPTMGQWSILILSLCITIVGVLKARKLVIA